uniref:Uncharacterized protein n=1 Tax=Arundo donax TaxID=35708 RepID=A0A0A9BXE8_ARUDO
MCTSPQRSNQSSTHRTLSFNEGFVSPGMEHNLAFIRVLYLISVCSCQQVWRSRS